MRRSAEAGVPRQKIGPKWLKKALAKRPQGRVDYFDLSQGYAGLWVRDVRIDYRSAFACTNPFCAPRHTHAAQASIPLRCAA